MILNKQQSNLFVWVCFLLFQPFLFALGAFNTMLASRFTERLNHNYNNGVASVLIFTVLYFILYIQNRQIYDIIFYTEYYFLGGNKNE